MIYIFKGGWEKKKSKDKNEKEITINIYLLIDMMIFGGVIDLKKKFCLIFISKIPSLEN